MGTKVGLAKAGIAMLLVNGAVEQAIVSWCQSEM